MSFANNLENLFVKYKACYLSFGILFASEGGLGCPGIIDECNGWLARVGSMSELEFQYWGGVLQHLGVSESRVEPPE